jgi:hypothetical protein
MMKARLPNSTYPKTGVSCPADTFVLKIAAFAKLQTVIGYFRTTEQLDNFDF